MSSACPESDRARFVTTRAADALFAATAFVGSFLLFAVQPLLGKHLLPWFGGSPTTWSVCMLFFQAALLVGYVHAHILVQRVDARTQRMWLFALLVAALAWLPVTPTFADRPTGEENPAFAILAILARRVGLPYVLLATASPLLQRWYARAGSASPTRLFAVSNAGSLLALLAYPAAIEPFPATLQAQGWSCGFALFALLACGCAAVDWRARSRAGAPLGASLDASGASPATASNGSDAGAHAASRTRWFVLSFVPSVMLLATTHHISMDVAVVPLLWVVPLALYLLSFVLAFGFPGVSRWAVVLPLWVIATGAIVVSELQETRFSVAQQLAVFLSASFLCGLICHGALWRTRPIAARLTEFYVWIAAGGAAGGILVALIAPVVFPAEFELELAVLATHLCVLWMVLAEPRASRRPAELRWAALGVGLASPLVAGALWVHATDRSFEGAVVERRRGFHGVLRVTDHADVRILTNGRIRHGMQYRDATRARLPVMYYGPDTGVGRVFSQRQPGQHRQVGAIGLGTGTLAAYGQAGDHFRFYELNPDVVDLARMRFSYLADTAADVEVVVGDARLALEREAPHAFDILVLDAFTGDAVPVHLLTVEAFASYLRQLAPTGVLVINVSSRQLDIDRVVAGSARHHGLATLAVQTPRDIAHHDVLVRWMLVARSESRLRALASAEGPGVGAAVEWTDARNSLLEIVR